MISRLEGLTDLTGFAFVDNTGVTHIELPDKLLKLKIVM